MRACVYSVPSTASDWQAGGTETIIGNYLARVGPAKRDEIVVASKIAGYWPASPVATARSEQPTTGSVEDCRLDAKSVKTACEASLRRLQTDRIDLYQVHWPDRYVPIFGQTEFKHDMKRQDSVPIEETAAAMRDLIEEGKVRYIGLSNETPLGVCQWVQACEKLGIRDKLATIQNSYSLIDRRFDGDLAEVCDEYNIGLLSWSILAGGLLSGKYQSKNDINKSRYTLYPDFMSRSSPVSATPQTLRAVEQYNEISQKAGMTPAELAVAFCRSRRFVSDSGSTIVGATTMQQLKENLDAFNRPVELSEDVLEAIDKVHVQCPNPSCSLWASFEMHLHWWVTES